MLLNGRESFLLDLTLWPNASCVRLDSACVGETVLRLAFLLADGDNEPKAFSFLLKGDDCISLGERDDIGLRMLFTEGF